MVADCIQLHVAKIDQRGLEISDYYTGYLFLFTYLLLLAGYNYYGTERLYSGETGIEMEADIFMGIVYYQRLRHMVSDKFQVCRQIINKTHFILIICITDP